MKLTFTVKVFIRVLLTERSEKDILLTESEVANSDIHIIDSSL